MFNKNLKLALFTFLLLISAILPVSAQNFPAPEGYVLDQTATLTSEQEQNLESTLKNFEDKTTNEIAIAIIPNLDGEALEDYANKLFENWGIGQKEKDNGILILVVKEERKIRIEVGYGLEGAVNDAFAGDVIRQQMTPNFRENKYYEGLVAASSTLINRIDEKYASENNLQQNIITQNSTDQFLEMISKNVDFIFFGFIFLISVIIPYFSAFLGRSKSWWLGGLIGFIFGIIIALISIFVPSNVFGFGLFLCCPLPLAFLGLIFDYILSKNYKILEKAGKDTDFWHTAGGFYTGGGGWSNGNSSGGSFGGGSSGGGGASGGW